MKILNRILIIGSIAVAVGAYVGQESAARERFGVPDYYRRLDTSLPFNDMARASLDPKISTGEYDAIRWQYFVDRVSPNYGPLQQAAAWEDFRQRTERPDSPDRKKNLRDYENYFDLAFLVATLYLALALVLWTWSRVLRPTKAVLQNEGLNGVFHRILFGKTGNEDRA